MVFGLCPHRRGGAPEGQPSDFSLHGPWVGVAAPGEQLTSLNPNGNGLINAWPDPQHGPVPIDGTSFAAPFVSGVAALIRARFPQMSATEVMERIKRTAHTPGAGPNMATGYGVVDPLAALTYELPPRSHLPDPLLGHPISPPSQQAAGSSWPRTIVLAGVVACVALGLLAIAVFRKPPARPGPTKLRREHEV